MDQKHAGLILVRAHARVAGLIPGWGAYPGWGVCKKATNQCFSFTSMVRFLIDASLSLSLSVCLSVSLFSPFSPPSLKAMKSKMSPGEDKNFFLIIPPVL